MSAQPVLAAEAEALRCDQCDEVVLAKVRHMFGELVHLSLEVHSNLCNLVVTKAGDQWLVRDLVPGESVPPGRRRLRHECLPHPHKCGAATSVVDSRPCGAPARLYPIGTRCERHRP